MGGKINLGGSGGLFGGTDQVMTPEVAKSKRRTMREQETWLQLLNNDLQLLEMDTEKMNKTDPRWKLLFTLKYGKNQLRNKEGKRGLKMCTYKRLGGGSGGGDGDGGRGLSCSGRDCMIENNDEQSLICNLQQQINLGFSGLSFMPIKNNAIVFRIGEGTGFTNSIMISITA